MVLAGAGFGAQSVLAKVAYDGGADVPTVLAVRFGVASCLIWTFVAVRARVERARPAEVSRERWAGIAALGLLFVTSALFAYLALDRLPAGTTTLLVFVYPALVVLWSRLLFGERITRRRGWALALALVGCALTVDPASVVATGAGLSGAGIAWAIGSAVSNSWYATLAGPITRGLPGLTVAAYSLPVTAVCFVGGLVALGGPAAGITVGGWLASAAIGLLVAASTAAFLAGVARIGPSRAAIAATSEPATAVVLGVVVLGESVSGAGLLGAGCIVAAILILAGSRPVTSDVARKDSKGGKGASTAAA